MIQPSTIHFPLCALYSDDPNDHSYCPGDHSVECESCTRRGKGVRAPPGTKPSGAQAGWTRPESGTRPQSIPGPGNGRPLISGDYGFCEDGEDPDD
jgi:hypothetical protein